MKTLPLLIGALILTPSAHADVCAEKIQHAFDTIKPRAVAFVPSLRPTAWKFKWFMPDTSIAQVRLVVPDIEVNESVMCKLVDSEIEAVIAHEFGHLISRTLNDEHMLTAAGREDYANYYGAKLVPDSTAYLAILDARCKAGSPYFCEASKAWHRGLSE